MVICYHCMSKIEDDNARNCAYCGKLLHEELPEGKYLKPGTVLQNKFVVGYPIGAGGFGNTYIGWNKLLLRKVAIKEFYPEQYITRKEDGVTVTVESDDLQPRFRKGLQQFLEEARSVAALQDIRGVVEISNFFEENGTGYIIMEYLEGMDVKTILKKSGDKKDYEWCRRVILTVLHTLREVHKRGVLHRDIAPDNIFVTNEGVIKLIDFGAAKHATALANMKADVVLKVGYAPIEQYSKNSKQGPYTDLYAVAALFYRMLTGQKPLPANERLENDTLVMPSEMGIEIPEQAELAIMVCLNVRPEYRLQSADEFMEALDGRDFVPVYEPEWILPAVEEKKGWQAMSLSVKISLWVAAIALVIGLGVVGYAVTRPKAKGNIDIGDDRYMLADYTGQQVSEASKELDDLGIKYYIIYEYSDEDYGKVLRQSPAPGETDLSDGVSLYVSGANKNFTLDDFTGKTKKEIIDYFSNMNFKIKEDKYPNGPMTDVQYHHNKKYTENEGTIILSYYYSDDYKKDICYKQTVARGEQFLSTDSVKFLISVGKRSNYEIMVPDFSGMTLDEVEETLDSSGLRQYLNVEYEDAEEENEEIEKGKIQEQSVKAKFIYNNLENRFYRYKNKEQIQTIDGNKLVLTVSIGKEVTTEATTEAATEVTTEIYSEPNNSGFDTDDDHYFSPSVIEVN